MGTNKLIVVDLNKCFVHLVHIHSAYKRYHIEGLQAFYATILVILQLKHINPKKTLFKRKYIEIIGLSSPSIAQNSLLPFWLPLFGVVTVPTTLWSCLRLTFKFDDDVDVVFFVRFGFAFAVVFCFCRFDGHEFTFDDEKDDNNDRALSLSLSAPDANFPGAP